MDSENEKKQLVEYDNLNTAGKAVFIAGTAYKIAERAIDYTFSTLSGIWAEAEKAFQSGLNEGNEENEGDGSDMPSKEAKDAVILEETSNKLN
jgi:hypothetical protein